MCLYIGMSKTIKFPTGTYEKLGVPVLKHFRVLSCSVDVADYNHLKDGTRVISNECTVQLLKFIPNY